MKANEFSAFFVCMCVCVCVCVCELFTGAEAKKVFNEAQAMLDDIINGELLTAHGIVGLFPANSTGDDIIIYEDWASKKVKGTLYGLRQQARMN